MSSTLNLLEDKEYMIYELAEKHQFLSEKIAELQKAKDEITNQIVQEIGHDKEGAQSYPLVDRVVTVTTNKYYKADAKAYEKYKEVLGSFNPVIEKVSYSVDKSKFKEFETYGNSEVKRVLSEVVTVSEAKASVKVSFNDSNRLKRVK